MNLKLSVIIPAYCAEKTISRCIQSCLNQDYSSIEVIAINDGSKDNTLQLLKAVKDERLFIIDKQNEGVGKARNAGLEVATGEYVIFLDADDEIPSNYIERLVSNIELNNSDIALCGYVIDKGDKRTYVKPRKNLTNEPLKDFLVDNIVSSPWAKIYKRAIIKENNIFFSDDKIMEDAYFNLHYFKHVKLVSKEPDVFYIYNKKNSTSTVDITDKKFEFIQNALLKLSSAVSSKVYGSELEIRLLRLGVLFPLSSGYFSHELQAFARKLIAEDILKNKYIKKNEIIAVFLISKSVIAYNFYRKLVLLIKKIKYER